MEKELLTIKGNRKVLFPDALFLYIEWKGNANLKKDEELADIIDDLDTEYFPSNKKESIAQSLPFLTFKQAELLFREIKKRYSEFTLKGIALASQPMEQNGRVTRPTTGVPSIEGQPQITPFVITKDYKELVTPLIEEAHRDKRFEKTTYEGISNFFSGPMGLLPCYAESLGLSLVDMPPYPKPGTIEGELPNRLMSNKDKHKQSVAGAKKRKEKTGRVYEDEEVGPPSKLPLVLAIGSCTLSVFLLLMLMVYNSNFTRVKKELVSTTDKVERLTMIQDHEHEIDVMARYFLSYYYSGDKDKLKAYLDNNDAKFTNPEVATVSSTMLEKVELVKNEKDTYEVTYVVGTTDEAQKTTVRRVTFNVKKKPSATQGWVVTSEPTTTAFATPTSPSTETSAENTENKEG